MSLSYPDAIRFLSDLRLFGAKLGLDNTFQLAARIGNPQQHLRFIHVAGTNGKGSVCAMLESIYRASGLKVGLFTSPHLVSFSERIQVNRQLIPAADVAHLVEEFQSALKEFPSEAHPTFFEVVTVMALKYFADQQCDLVIWETGMGGRLDATNIVTPLASVITTIDLDHEKWLGHSLSQIAAEKGGIIKPHTPVIVGEQKPEPIHVLQEIAARQGSPFIRTTPDDLKRTPLDSIQLPLLGDHQKQNAALALKVARVLSPQIPVSDDDARSGLMTVTWPGRMQLVRPGPGRTLILDGAHNPVGAEILRAALQKHFSGMLVTLILGALQDKNWQMMCRTLAPLAGRIRFVPVKSERSADPVALQNFAAQLNPYAEIRASSSVKEALDATLHDPLVVITGSLYLVGEALELLNLLPQSSEAERQLNEWKMR